jgi:hypothetical protein
MVSDRRRVSSYLATNDITSPEYAVVRVAVFGFLGVVFLVLAVTVEPALGLFAAFCALATLLWTHRWRRALRDDKAVR